MGKIIVIGSQKGGVGKTTTTLNLAYSLREMGKKVLTVDFDSQANLTTCYGVEDTGVLEYTIGHLMMAQIEEEVTESFEDYIQSRDGVDYLPSSIYLSVVVLLSHMVKRMPAISNFGLIRFLIFPTILRKSCKGDDRL